MRPFSRRRTALRSGAPPETVTQRLDRLEAMIEGLQDAVYREAQRQERQIEDVRDRTRPTRIAQALSDDARHRGL